MINRNIDGAKVAFLFASMDFTLQGLEQKIIDPSFAAQRLRFDIEIGQKMIGQEMVASTTTVQQPSEAADLAAKLTKETNDDGKTS